MSSHGFQWTPGGPIPLGESPPEQARDAAGSLVLASAVGGPSPLPSAPLPTVNPVATLLASAASAGPVSAKVLLAAARARVRELRRTIPALERELRELSRLCEAASPRRTKTLRPVRAPAPAPAPVARHG